MDVSIEENLDTTDKRELGDYLIALLSYGVVSVSSKITTNSSWTFLSFRSGCNFFD